MAELDKENPIPANQSTTIQAAVRIIIVQAVIVFAAITGKVVDVEAVKSLCDTWLPVAVMVVGVYSAWKGKKVIDGRKAATQTIAPKPEKEP